MYNFHNIDKIHSKLYLTLFIANSLAAAKKLHIYGNNIKQYQCTICAKQASCQIYLIGICANESFV